jgi:tetratricopeptide (TPR) repeat protein
MSEPLISVCMIARDEEELIGDCLRSVVPLADEIVVVDTGSRDATPAIARAAGARLVEQAWSDDFAAARNAGLEVASGRFVLFVDADERLEPAPVDRLRRRLERREAPAFSVEVVSPLGDGREEIAHITRLFENRPEHRYRGRIHEQILGAVCERLGVETFDPPRSGLRLHHLGYLPERRASRAKSERNLTLLRSEIAARPDDPGVRFLYARERAPRIGGDLLDMPEAHEALERLAPAADRFAELTPRGLTGPALALAARLATISGRADEAARWAGALRAALGSTAEGCYAEGETLLAAAVAGSPTAGEAAARFGAAERAPAASDAMPVDERLRSEWAPLRAELSRRLAGGTAGPRAAPGHAGAAVERALFAGFSAAAAGDPRRALGLLAEGLREVREDPRAWWAVGACTFLLGDHQRAAGAAGTALELAPGWTAAAALARGMPGEGLPAGMLAGWSRLLVTA